jgi:SpoVK/Ycf46/Vps4 family AAA+-type ATPase
MDKARLLFSGSVSVSIERGISNNMDILDKLEKIVEISRKYGINKCLQKGKSYLDYVTKKLDINPIQAVLFSHFMERSDENQIMVSEIAESIKCSKIRIIKHINECEELEKKKLIRCRRDEDSISFRIPRDVRDSLRKFDEFRPEKKDNLSVFEFFTALEDLFSDRNNNELTFNALRTELLDLIHINMHLLFCKKIMSYKLREDYLVLLILFCVLFSNDNDDNIGFHDLQFLFDNRSEASSVKKGLSDGSHTLVASKYVEFTNNNGFVNNESWKLSDMAKKELLSEIGVAGKNYLKNIIRHDAIQCKKMFYNEKESGEIQKLISLLKEENYSKVQDRLSGNGMRKGFACLFSGSPGTGKTETAYQIARETGRNIMMVDIADTKSCWFGESEKKIKEVFNTYRYAVENSEITPILLLNEADAVIGKRKEFDSSNNHAVDQTENTIQNIILQEMENLSGILIATTNLTQNMDKAFERRFLYKIEFSRPSLAARQSIWQSMMSSLAETDAEALASRFDLSGGQIENIARKAEVDTIINGSRPSTDILAQYCKDENQNNLKSEKTIGFGNS